MAGRRPKRHRQPGRGGCPIQNRILRASRETGTMFSRDYCSPSCPPPMDAPNKVADTTNQPSSTGKSTKDSAPCCNLDCKDRQWHDVRCLSVLPFTSEYLLPEECEEESKFSLDLRTGIHALQHYLGATWWKWDCGSALLFWRFPTEESQKATRDSWPVWWMPSNIPLPLYK